jgi:hypothetical protein
MKRCPYCGVKNLDTDIECFNCERSLDGPRQRGSSATAAVAAAPAVERTARRREPEPERQMELRDIETERRPGGFLALAVANISTKLLFFLGTLGLFFLASLLSIWLAYDSLVAAAVSFSIFVVGFVATVVYPDIRSGLRGGIAGWKVALSADLIFMTGAILPSLLYLAKKGYIEGVWPFVQHYWWALLLLPALGTAAAALAGRRNP